MPAKATEVDLWCAKSMVFLNWPELFLGVLVVANKMCLEFMSKFRTITNGFKTNYCEEIKASIHGAMEVITYCILNKTGIF